MYNLALLTSVGDPLFGYLLDALLVRKIKPSLVLIDQKGWSERDYLIYTQRVGEKLPARYPEPVSNIPFVQVSSHTDETSLDSIERHGCQLIVNGGTPRIITKEFIDRFEMILNCHPGILPMYRGCSAVEWSIYNNDLVGNTIHLMSVGIDEGDIIDREIVNICENDSYQDVRVKVYRRGFTLMVDVISRIKSGVLYKEKFVTQNDGVYWKPITADKFEISKKMVNSGEYFRRIIGDQIT